MTVLFASGDVGGARALLPVMHYCSERSIPFLLADRGTLSEEAPEKWERLSRPSDIDPEKERDVLKRMGVTTVVFTSSVEDTVALTLARRAKEAAIPVIHVLDGWTGYRRRMETDGLPLFVPDIYTVIDEIAFEDAAKEGIRRDILRVTGQPALSSLRRESSLAGVDALGRKRSELGIESKRTFIVFVSEPAKKDQGASLESPYYRGYTEDSVLETLCGALQEHADRVHVGLIVHPRENREELQEIWEKFRGTLQGGLLREHFGRDGVLLADGVSGMASLLLYEAWLLGKPVMSIQPNLRLEPLRMLERRDGVVFVDKPDDLAGALEHWLASIPGSRATKFRPEVAAHENAPERVYELIKTYMNKK